MRVGLPYSGYSSGSRLAYQRNGDERFEAVAGAHVDVDTVRRPGQYGCCPSLTPN